MQPDDSPMNRILAFFQRRPWPRQPGRPPGDFLFCMIAAFIVTPLAQAAPQIVRFGIVPQTASSKLAEDWMPLLAYLSQATALDSDPRGRGLLAAVGMPGFESARDSQWNDIRSLNIDLLEHLLRE